MTLLTVAEFKLASKDVITMDDGAVADMLEAAELAINARYGELGSFQTEVHDGGSSYLFLRHPAVLLSEIVERVSTIETTLEEDDYRIRGDQVSVLRLSTGTTPRSRWGETTVSYLPVDDSAERKRVQRALVLLDLNFAPGISMEQIGSWLEQHHESSVWNYGTERQTILNSLQVSYAPGFA